MTSPYTATTHWAWLRGLPEFRAALDRRRKVLTAPRRGRPFSNFGPEQIARHTTSSARASRLLGSLIDPKVSELAGVVPTSLRPLLWLELHGVFTPSIATGGSLQPIRRDRLQQLCLKRLHREPLTDAERQFLGRMLALLDPGVAPEVALPKRYHPAAEGWNPEPGEPLAIHATGAAQGRPIATPSYTGHPVVGEIVNVDAKTIVFKL